MPTYKGMSSEAFRHPLDREAEQTLRSLPGFDIAARKFVEFFYERPQFVYHMGNSIQVGPRQYSTVYQMFRECVRDLDIYPEPTLFISQFPVSNAYALGQERPSIVLNSGLLDLMTEAELRSVIAHELGHIKCGHTILTQMALWVISTASFIGELTLGLGNIIGSGLVYAFYEWKRRSELSADRAALLLSDDINSVMRAMMKLAGGSGKYNNEASLDEFIRQSERYQELDDDGLNQVYKFLLYNNLAQGVFLSHPFLVERIIHLRQWSNSDEYRQIRHGNYQHSAGEGAVDVPSQTGRSQADELRRQIEELQREIDNLKRKSE
ncbi:M48 family metallopeptidase [Planktothrix sp. FACHB-1355]|uniref:M48 family metallopeptidase n=1 Tax=Aerosakkonema funiforme FACHB-1375 TaxID=2949571 RepID=A0A926VNF3_9CYAN|nr:MULTISPECIES: M48 family metalloprotease [Oscillatoriales]MBD2186423.1 M48 family metallopeptidase [Aerosakkonema funiforme FACHB-1375]MBD3562091.1 M48 family metallopeptidase [Planktothrix sp. FACHB-1355]